MIRLSQDRTWGENTSDREWKPAGWAATSSFTTSLEAPLGEFPPHHGLRCISQAKARPHRTENSQRRQYISRKKYQGKLTMRNYLEYSQVVFCF